MKCIKTFESFDQDSFYHDVALHLSKMFNGKVLLDGVEEPIEDKGRSRRITFILPAGDEMVISHSWRMDGTPNKPVTDIFIHPDIEISLGRFAIWPDSKTYAEDIFNVIKDKMGIEAYVDPVDKEINSPVDFFESKILKYENFLNESTDFSFKLLSSIFEEFDAEKIIVNGAQIISIIVSFFGKFGMRISLTIESLLFLYWIWKYETSSEKDEKQDALVQLIFSGIGFATFSVLPAFKAISKTFSMGYKEYRLTGEVSKIQKLPAFKEIFKHKEVLVEGAANIEKLVQQNIKKLPSGVVKESTKKELNIAAKNVKEYIDDIFNIEKKVVKKSSSKLSELEELELKARKVRRPGKLSRLLKLGKRLYPGASYLLNRFLNKKKKPKHLEDVNDDIIILQYQIDHGKIVGASFPNDLDINAAEREDKNGKVVPTIIALKILINDIDGRKFIKNSNILTESDEDTEYYLAVGINGEPIYSPLLLFAVKDNNILVCTGSDQKIDFKNIKNQNSKIKASIINDYSNLDEITIKTFKKIIDVYNENEMLDNSYIMWQRMINKTFTIKWWEKNFKIEKAH